MCWNRYYFFVVLVTFLLILNCKAAMCLNSYKCLKVENEVEILEIKCRWSKDCNVRVDKQYMNSVDYLNLNALTELLKRKCTEKIFFDNFLQGYFAKFNL